LIQRDHSGAGARSAVNRNVGKPTELARDRPACRAQLELATRAEFGYYWATGDPDNVLTLDSGRLAAATIPIGTGWLLGACMEARGKQDL